MESELESLNTSQSWSAERGDVQDLLHQEFRYEELMYTTPSNAEEIALKLKVDEACKNFLLGKKGIREAAAELAINPEIIRG